MTVINEKPDDDKEEKCCAQCNGHLSCHLFLFLIRIITIPLFFVSATQIGTKSIIVAAFLLTVVFETFLVHQLAQTYFNHSLINYNLLMHLYTPTLGDICPVFFNKSDFISIRSPFTIICSFKGLIEDFLLPIYPQFSVHFFS